MAKQEKEVVDWITVRGKHLPVYKNTKKADEKTQGEHKNAIKELGSNKYEDGTYDIKTKKTKSFNSGYQVTFCQIGDNYSDADYAKKVNECLELSSDGRTYAGKFGGTPEISFHCKDRKSAIEYGKKNNQESVLDWAELQKANKLGDKYGYDSPQYLDQLGKAFISTGGTGRRNKS